MDFLSSSISSSVSLLIKNVKYFIFLNLQLKKTNFALKTGHNAKKTAKQVILQNFLFGNTWQHLKPKRQHLAAHRFGRKKATWGKIYVLPKRQHVLSRSLMMYGRSYLKACLKNGIFYLGCQGRKILNQC